MTRINLVAPSYLTNKHLIAEYRELPRIFTAVLKLQKQGKTPSDVNIPDQYVLGEGHVKFFYNKISWLRSRYGQIYYELILSRGYSLDEDLWLSVLFSSYDIEWTWSEPYDPTPDEIYLNMARICKRSKLDNVITEIYE